MGLRMKEVGWIRRSGTIFMLMVLVLHASRTLGCDTLPSTLHITKEIYYETGELERTCEGDVAVSKCEGSCISRVRPSAVSHTGFYKDCQCCRETSLRSRTVTLTKCFDLSGKALRGDKETYSVTLKEPANCKCYRCGEPPTPSPTVL